MEDRLTSNQQMRTADFDYVLPSELIAQHPTENRDQSRLLVLERSSGSVSHRQFQEFGQFFRRGDVLILNNSRVFPARVRGKNSRTEGKFEMLLLQENNLNDWWVMLRPGKRAPVGTKIDILDRAKGFSGITAEVTEINFEGHRRLHFSGTENIFGELEKIGEIPLPPYIERTAPIQEDLERYQTVYSREKGSVAAPTAGLHFTPGLLQQLEAAGVEIHYVTLHVGLGTFAPVKADSISEHVMHEERFELSAATANAINRAKQEKRRVIAVGTTTVRVLETAAQENETLVPVQSRTKIFIFPPYQFKIVDALITNFHLPRSTLLMLISAFAAPGETRGQELILNAYEEAIRERYRFFSYGDAMLII